MAILPIIGDKTQVVDALLFNNDRENASVY